MTRTRDSGQQHGAGLKIYRDGLDAMKAAKYPHGRRQIHKLSSMRIPKSPLSEPAEYFAANALFEIGARDPQLRPGDFAVQRSRDALSQGQLRRQRLLREAQAFVKLNDRIDARLTLQKLVADHPGTPEAAAADTMMKSMASN